MSKKYQTDRLFTTSSFFTGIGSAISISGSYYEFNLSDSDSQADSDSIESDWSMVGDDIRAAIEKTISKEVIT